MRADMSGSGAGSADGGDDGSGAAEVGCAVCDALPLPLTAVVGVAIAAPPAGARAASSRRAAWISACSRSESLPPPVLESAMSIRASAVTSG